MDADLLTAPNGGDLFAASSAATAPPTAAPLRVFLVDDHATLREPLAFLIEREPDMTVVGQAGSLAEARRAIADGLAADIALVDLRLPDGDGTDLVAEFRAADPSRLVLVVTASEDLEDHARAVEAGAAGVLLKALPIGELIGAVRRLGAGESVLPPDRLIELLRRAAARRDRDREADLLLRGLTPREQEVLRALADGLSDKEIAARLHVAGKTVRVHMANILAKLGLESRLQALVFAVRHGAVEID